MAKYMHTIEGRPATFDGYQICYATFYGQANKLADSLAEIRRDQRVTKINRERDGFGFKEEDYGYFRYE